MPRADQRDVAPRGYVTGAEVAAVRVPKTAELVAAAIRRDIVLGVVETGSTLAPESELMEQFGVSRPTLREAIRLLEAESLISPRRGVRSGAVVHAPNADSVVRLSGAYMQYDGIPLADLYGARAIMEAPAAARLATEASAEGLAELRAIHAAADEAMGDEKRVAILQADFHRAVVALAGNETMTLVSEIVNRLIDVNVRRRMTDASAEAGVPARLRTAQRSHEKLLRLIESSDATAEQFWFKHLTESGRFSMGDAGDQPVVGFDEISAERLGR